MAPIQKVLVAPWGGVSCSGVARSEFVEGGGKTKGAHGPCVIKTDDFFLQISHIGAHHALARAPLVQVRGPC